MNRIERRDGRLEEALYSECNYHELERFLEEERRRKLRKIRAWEWALLVVLNGFAVGVLIWTLRGGR